MSITIKDVAKKANVSASTVSRILNNLPGYSEETRQKVEKVIEELGYQPNAIARGLINRQTKIIGVLVPRVSDLFAGEILAGIEEQAQDLGYSVMICKTNNRTRDYLRTLYEKRVDGIIMVSGAINPDSYKEIEMMNVPVVVVAAQPNYPKIPSININEYQASYDAIKYLVEKGHSHIGMIAGTKGDDRIKGFKDALNDAGITVTDHMITYGDYHFDSGVQGMAELIENYPSITGVFCASDEMAVGALSCLYKHGISVPEKISIVGFDNTSAAKKAVPPLTTVAQPLYDMGESAIHLLLDPSSEGNKVYPHHIIERDTVRSLRRK
ncbi:LacI family DNA-binding transcriptional regulator [Metabacillus arenae]|uniref:LacI family DNA-binding transcriptional regulator n=1 Tax=Metabacillus arenae TaxID=2771434 RepID=A0A926N7H0_9BACI|nr:LacI family DNA-binding transcriptional regulator [Metabacillus arenae]MBD1378727.1 LacI family DNA-binding transcriptional regulator [Metabacillus arenae]